VSQRILDQLNFSEMAEETPQTRMTSQAWAQKAASAGAFCSVKVEKTSPISVGMLVRKVQ
jgi:hypothetical protein